MLILTVCIPRESLHLVSCPQAESCVRCTSGIFPVHISPQYSQHSVILQVCTAQRSAGPTYWASSEGPAPIAMLYPTKQPYLVL